MSAKYIFFLGLFTILCPIASNACDLDDRSESDQNPDQQALNFKLTGMYQELQCVQQKQLFVEQSIGQAEQQIQDLNLENEALRRVADRLLKKTKIVEKDWMDQLNSLPIAADVKDQILTIASKIFSDEPQEITVLVTYHNQINELLARSGARIINTSFVPAY